MVKLDLAVRAHRSHDVSVLCEVQAPDRIRMIIDVAFHKVFLLGCVILPIFNLVVVGAGHHAHAIGCAWNKFAEFDILLVADQEIQTVQLAGSVKFPHLIVG